ncbi:MAG: helix-turn-helix transcriptional regulator [Gemmatimonadetes bacterium]|nr:helix-turn-helix transcriptional regulator [Gemmatimonadota bacterium]
MAIHSPATRLDQVFHALSDPTRRAMLARLATSHCTAGELGAPFRISQPSVSKHIRVLERAGVVRRSVKGRHHTLRLVPAPLRDAEMWITRHRQFWEGSLGQLDRVLAELQRDE